VLELDVKVVPKNISIGNGVERGAEAINADNCGSNQVGWIIVMVMKKIFHLHAVDARRLLGIGQYQCLEGLEAVIIDGMVVKRLVVL
jgi:hypothetical protein